MRKQGSRGSRHALQPDSIAVHGYVSGYDLVWGPWAWTGHRMTRRWVWQTVASRHARRQQWSGVAPPVLPLALDVFTHHRTAQRRLRLTR